MGNSIFSLAGLKLPYQSRSRLRQKNGGASTLLSYNELEDDVDDKYSARKTKWGGTKAAFSLATVIKVLLLMLAFALFYVHRRFSFHIEIQTYENGWISETILPTPPLSSTCFDPAKIQQTDYNLTLANAPAFVEVHAGLGMSLGDDCFNFAGTIPREPLPEMILPEHTIFHTYWRADLLPLGRRQISLLHSLLSMQDRDTTSVILWTNSDTTNHLKSHTLLKPLVALYGNRFSIQTVNKQALAQGTPMEGSGMLNLADKRAWLDGDLVRILVLHAMGGMWVDMDTIMTGRDVRVLGEGEWVTQWDCYDKPYSPLNGAMMHFFKHSPFLCEMMYAMAHDPPPRKGTTDWGSILYHKVWRRLVENGIKPFKILPYCFTDGHTCRLDNRLPNPFAKRDTSWGKGRIEALAKKVDNVFAVHLHNQWDKEFPKDGWVKQLILTKIQEAVTKYRFNSAGTTPSLSKQP